MATLTISLSDSGVVNGSKSYTVSDADIQNVIDWAKAAFATPATRENPNPPPLTNTQALLAWVQSWINDTKAAVQRFKTIPAVVPPPPTFT